MRLLLIALGLLLLTTATNAWAHGGHAHHGTPTGGTIATVNGDHLTLTTDSGSLAVTVTETTHIVAGEKELDRKALTPKTRVSVFGTKLESGELVAEDIHVEGTGARAHATRDQH